MKRDGLQRGSARTYSAPGIMGNGYGSQALDTPRTGAQPTAIAATIHWYVRGVNIMSGGMGS